MYMEQIIKLVHSQFQVSEWIVQVIISRSSNAMRREVLACILRIAQESWNIANYNGVMEILIGLR